MRIIIAHLALHCVAALRVFPRGTLRLVDSPRLTLDAVDAAAVPLQRSDGVYWLFAGGDGGDVAPALHCSTDAVAPISDTLLRLSVRPSQSPPPSAPSYTPNLSIGTALLHSDARVNIFEFRLRPGERCPYHTHKKEYCFVNLTTSLTQALSLAGEDTGEPNLQHAGKAVWVESEHLGAHGVRNIGDTTFLQFVIELV